MAEKNRKIGWKIGGTIIGACVVLVVIFLVWFLNASSPKEIISVADQFKPGSDWKLKSEYIRPPQIGCIDVECPAVERTWTLPAPISSTDFDKIIKQTGWVPSYDQECFFNKYINKPSDDCYIELQRGKYKQTIYVKKEDDLTEHKPTVSLSVTKK